ncbi:acetate--CoA ligase family protein [Streptomyces hirsutus]|uniref:acetate--CoA ligase family protein n=1 Tax=Streptomyces hirsutus TaxID=35620 RepID=UPI00341FA2AF
MQATTEDDTTTRTPSVEGRTPLQRVFDPRTIALVGMKPGHPLTGFIEPMLKTDARLYFVNPKCDEVLGHPSLKSVAEIPEPIDVVFSTMSAARTVDLVEECADLDCGGVVIYAAGFAETGETEGIELQQRLTAAAKRGNLAIVGPNSLGYINIPRRIRMTASTDYEPPSGKISIVTHSGAMMGGLAIAAAERRVGLCRLISAGNEPVNDMADYIEYLVDDPQTGAIGLVVEAIRRPEAFFHAVKRARDAGKPVVALKLARNARTQTMAGSHTGAVAGDAWSYEVAFKDAGIVLARDPEELIDRLSIVSQIAPERWTRVEKLGVVAGTGGFASIAFDVAEEEGVVLPELQGLRPWVVETIPGAQVPNPLDTTGFGVTYWTDIVKKYVASDELDALLFINMWGLVDDTPINRWLIQEVLDAAREHNKPVVVACGSGPVGEYGREIAGDTGALATGYGIRASIRGLQALGSTKRDDETRGETVPAPAPHPRPSGVIENGSDGPMLSWEAAHELLTSYGIPTLPFLVVTPDADEVKPPFEGPYVLKLADVAHRTEYGAVKVNVPSERLGEVIAELRVLASKHGVPPKIAIQPMADIQGELLIGIQNQSDVGPIVVLGLGGIFVEVLRKIGGRPAPLSRRDAEELIEEFRDVKLLHGFRGTAPWDLDQLADILVKFGTMAAACADWLPSLDVNPLVFGRQGYVAVDVLALVSN